MCTYQLRNRLAILTRAINPATKAILKSLLSASCTPRYKDTSSEGFFSRVMVLLI